MSNQNEISQAASVLGHKGGLSTSPAKQAAVRKNGKLGGRPTWAQRARERVLGDEDLEVYRFVLVEYDWYDPDHAKWVATAPKSELLDWAQAVDLCAKCCA
jgi:hypothetical protein